MGATGVSIHNTTSGKTVLVDMTGLHYDDGTVKLDLGSVGLAITLGGTTIKLNDADESFILADNGLIFGRVNLNSENIEFKNLATGKSLFIDRGDITHNLGVKTISVCVSGASKSMDIIASTPY